MAEGNEKQADQKKGAADLRTLIAQLLGVVELAECENCETAYGDDDPERCAECEGVYAAVLDAREAMKDPPPPPSAEKLALRGEPTARTIIEGLLDFASVEVHRGPDTPSWVEVMEAARAYLSTRAPAEEALIEAARAYKLEDIRTGHVVAEIGQRASLYAIGTASEALCAAARAIPISPTAVHDVLMASAARANKTDPDLATGLRTRAALALPVEGRAPAKRKKRPGEDCTCYMDCCADPHSGEWHQHGDEPCPEHPDAPMVDGPPPSFEKQTATGRAPDASHEKKLGKKGAK